MSTINFPVTYQARGISISRAAEDEDARSKSPTTTTRASTESAKKRMAAIAADGKTTMASGSLKDRISEKPLSTPSFESLDVSTQSDPTKPSWILLTTTTGAAVGHQFGELIHKEAVSNVAKNILAEEMGKNLYKIQQAEQSALGAQSKNFEVGITYLQDKTKSLRLQRDLTEKRKFAKAMLGSYKEILKEVSASDRISEAKGTLEAQDVRETRNLRNQAITAEGKSQLRLQKVSEIRAGKMAKLEAVEREVVDDAKAALLRNKQFQAVEKKMTAKVVGTVAGGAIGFAVGILIDVYTGKPEKQTDDSTKNPPESQLQIN